ncbi:hypothetical protein UPYG_G00088120 [Umbra pygmaea]|uniref:Immunoglobulin domain-containing protein n=1 Tax=Umbra pygmaea TaxID=75934 RepID=A0ABD0XZJ1_UMBPY
MNNKMALTILCCFMLWESFGADQQELTVKRGETVTLVCDIDLDYEIMWFVFRPDDSLSVVNTIRIDKNLNLNKHFDVRFKPVNNTDLFRSNLSIVNISDSDVGLYYCAEQRADMIMFGNGTKLSLTSDDLCCTAVGMKLSWFMTLIIAPICSVLLSALCVFYLFPRPGPSN